jgi:hypothetical protein
MIPHFLRVFLPALLAGAVFAGCQSVGEPESRSHASLRFAWPSLLEIQRSIEQVFGEQGFKLEKRAGEEWVFERPGTTGEMLKWGGLEGKGIRIRAKLKSRPVGPGEYLVECDVFVVDNVGEKFFEEETKPMLLPRSEYQKLLVEARRRLEAGPAPAL